MNNKTFEENAKYYLEQLPESWDMLHLGHNPYMCTKKSQIIFSHNLVVPNVECWTGFFAYAISRSGAEKSLALLNPLQAAIDNMMRDYFATLVSVYLATPNLVKHDFDIPSERVKSQTT